MSQLSPSAVKKFDANPMFTVDGNGNILPTTTQTVAPGGSVLIQPDPASASQYSGYVCAWQSGCKCSTIIANLGTENHMKINPTAYTVKSTAPTGNYTIYATTSESGGGGPSAMSGTGDIHIGS